MCKATVEGQEKVFGGPQAIGQGLNSGILYLMVAPYVLLFLLFRKKIVSFFKEFANAQGRVVSYSRSAVSLPIMPQVDVAINVYGKPAQTAVTLLSLVRHSGQHIHRIWFVEERRQPFGARFDALKAHFGDRLLCYRPAFWLGARSLGFRPIYRWGPLRRSVRYQVAWERSQQRLLFITHNDVLYTDDIIAAMRDRIEGSLAIGPVGQCWNCSAHYAGACSPDRFYDYRPDGAAWLRISTQYPGARADRYASVMEHGSTWPLPECRLNEWSALIDLQRARPVTMPFGPAIPLGASYGLDTGTQWFHDVLNMPIARVGERPVKHFDIAPYARHAWASSTGGGYPALTDKSEYDRGEAIALDHLRTHFPEYRT